MMVKILSLMILILFLISDVVMLHVLPLHHVHGLIIALLTPLFIGAKILMLPQFDASKVIGKSILFIELLLSWLGMGIFTSTRF